MTLDHGRPRVRTATLAAIGRRCRDGVPTVLGEEDVLEVRFAADDVDQAVRAAAAMTAPIGPLTRIETTFSVALTSLTFGMGSKTEVATGPLKVSSTWWNASRRIASIRSTWTRRPSRMIATRSQVRSTSSMMCDERKIVRPSARLAHEREERLLDERVEARGRLVEDQQVRSVLERHDQADLLLVALRVLLEAPARIEVQPLDEQLA